MADAGDEHHPPPQSAVDIGGDEAPLNESITAKAKREYERAGDHIWDVAEPITVKGLTVKRDGAGASSSSKAEAEKGDDSQSLTGAPNFATAVLGRWTAKKVGVGGKSPPAPLPSSAGGRSESNANVVTGVDAAFLPGESTLLLGPSSSGKTTLMRTVSDIISGKIKVDEGGSESSASGSPVSGRVRIGGRSPAEIEAAGMNVSRRSAFVDQSDLTLTPILTVDETVRFAKSCAEPCDDPEEFERQMDALLRLAGLDHVRGTVVGNADVRGVSGGQKRRVKVLEMCHGSEARAVFFDEITNGLDAASALSICKVIRAAVEVVGLTAVTCLLQPSSDVFEQFHRLVLLTPDGDVAFSGRRELAVSHFESLGLRKPEGMNVPEFLLRCASSPADFWETSEAPPPESVKSAPALAAAARTSDVGRDLSEEIDRINAAASKKNEEAAGDFSAPAPDFAQPTSKQISLLLGRGWKLLVRNPASTQRMISAIIFGVFIGTLFLKTPADEKGTMTRAGYVLTLLFLVFLENCMAPLDDLFEDRLTFYTHRRSSMYRTSSYYLSQVICMLPVSIAETILLAVISFFLVGMENNGWWAFFYFLVLFILVALNGLAIARVLAYSLPTKDVASSLGPAALLFFTLSAGFAPQYNDIPAWIRWFAWISPCAFCYEGVIVNELHLRDVGDFDGNTFGQQFLGVPRIPYESAAQGLSTPGLVMGFDVYMLVVWMVAFDVLGFLLLHHSQKWYGPTTKRYQVGSGMSLTAPPWYKNKDNKNGGSSKNISEVQSGEVSSPGADSSSAIPAAPKAHLTCSKIVYEVDVPIVEDEPADDTDKEQGVDEEVDKSAAGQRMSRGTVDSKTASLIEHERSAHSDIPRTARDYGQAGRGSLQEWVLKRRLGSDALSSGLVDYQRIGGGSHATPFKTASTKSVSSSSGSTSLAGDEEGGFVDEDGLDPPEPGRLRLLSCITASFTPGTMTALMGESGAGKSTLLDVLAGYKTGGHIFGDININGREKTVDTWRSIAGYCEQVDLHNPAVTVRESLVFAARMRLRPHSVPDEEKVRFAFRIIALLDLDEFADMLVGDEASGEGLPKHARKRLTVGVELAGNPSILFADEPTSGLDSLSASVVVSSLERAAKVQGLTIVCTIHQPSREVFEAFDNLLLLRKGGVVVYNGPVPDLNSYVVNSSNKDGLALPDGANPADHALEVFCGPVGEGVDWDRLYKKSLMASEAATTFESCSCDSCEAGSISVDAEPPSLGSELWNVLQRQLLSHWRTPTYMAVRFWWTVLANVIVGLVYLKADEMKNIIGAIFFYVNIATVPLMSAATPLITERAVYYREVASGTYRRASYALAVQLAEIPFNLGGAIISFVIFYFLVGLDKTAVKVGYFILMALAMYWILPAFGQLFAFISPNLGAAIGTASLLMTLFTLTMGFLIPASEIPPWWIWLYWMNPLRYILQGFVSNELGGTPDGDKYLETQTWSYDQIWWYCYVATILFGAIAAVGILFATRISWLKR